MSASSKGTKDNPDKKVSQKAGLNRSILDASPFELRPQLEYKMSWNSGIVLAVPPQNTSRKCPECQYTSRENRTRQAKFVCVKCGFSANADWVGAFNIKEAGLVSLACLQSSSEVSTSCQEPTEEIQANSALEISRNPPHLCRGGCQQSRSLIFLVFDLEWTRLFRFYTRALSRCIPRPPVLSSFPPLRWVSHIGSRLCGPLVSVREQVPAKVGLG
jgi:predicted RNA-binding Zn-ribbon protein involved in translation (DUF1610 family)